MLDKPAGAKATIVFNDGSHLQVLGRKWSVVIKEVDGALEIKALHTDSAGKGSTITLPNPKV